MSYSFIDKFLELAKSQEKSDEYIRICVEYIKHLDEKKYPVIFSTVHLADLSGLTSDLISSILESRRQQYSYFRIKKRRGGFREIMSPNPRLKYIQKWIYLNILRNYPLNESCFGFRDDLSIKNNAEVHRSSRLILKVDLLKYYDTITENRVFGIFKAMGYVPNLARSFAEICTGFHRLEYWNDIKGKEREALHDLVSGYHAVLPQGAPSSPALANIVGNKMDKRFNTLGKIYGFRYSRYADDLTFSLPLKKKGRLPRLNQIERIIQDEGFFINKEKINYYKRGMKQYVTGITVTENFHVSKKYRKKIWMHLYYSKKYGPYNHLKSVYEKNNKDRSSIPSSFQDWLLGHISFIYSVNTNVGLKMYSEFNKIDWRIN